MGDSVSSSESYKDNAMKKVLKYLIGIVVALLAFYFAWNRYGTYITSVLSKKKAEGLDPKAPEMAAKYNKEVEEEVASLAKADAEEVMKKWKERFGGK